MRVLMFGRYADLAGWSERQMEAASLDALIDCVSDETPALTEHLRASWTLVTRNQRQVRGDATLEPDDEIAFMPPMSGG